MDYQALVPRAFDLTGYRFGMPQRSGALTIVPIFGPEIAAPFVGPLSGLKLARVHTYGVVELTNRADSGVAIVPLHIGYIQDGAQNHALCRAALLGAGQTRVFRDACCVQAAQGGFLEGRDQWFFVLPLPLREATLKLRGKEHYSKLWNEITRLNAHTGLAARGHLEQILTRQRATLTQFQSRFERLPGQTGGLFLLGDRLVGLEIAPTAAYFAELWMPLVCFGYGVSAMQQERQERPGELSPPFAARSLPELKAQLQQRRLDWQTQVQAWLAATPAETFTRQVEEQYLDYRLLTLEGDHFTGQCVEISCASPVSAWKTAVGKMMGRETDTRRDGATGKLVYASLFARSRYLEEILAARN